MICLLVIWLNKDDVNYIVLILFLVIVWFNNWGFNNVFLDVMINCLLFNNGLYILKVVVLKVIVFDNKMVVFLFNLI